MFAEEIDCGLGFCFFSPLSCFLLSSHLLFFDSISLPFIICIFFYLFQKYAHCTIKKVLCKYDLIEGVIFSNQG